MSDLLRRVLYPTAVLIMIGTIWSAGWAQSLQAQADRIGRPTHKWEQDEPDAPTPAVVSTHSHD